MSGGKIPMSFEDSSMSPTVASSFPATGPTPTLGKNDKDSNNNHADVQAARRGLLKAIWQTALAPRFSSRPIDLLTTKKSEEQRSAFSSKPIDMEGYFSGVERQNSLGNNSVASSSRTSQAEGFRNSLRESTYLTRSERGYLEDLLQSEDPESIRRASLRLSDKEIFPTDDDDDDKNEEEEQASKTTTSTTKKKKPMLLPPTVAPKRRDSQVQEQLFKWHEKTTIMPSVVLQRMSSSQSAKKHLSRRIPNNNSLTQDDDDDDDENDNDYVNDGRGTKEPRGSTRDRDNEDVQQEQQEQQVLPDKVADDDGDEPTTWDYSDLKDLNSWIAGTEGVEVDEEGHTTATANSTSNPFKILGIDPSCQPMVLSPPLMEGLQSFMPESLQEHHYWLKYSLVRDGPGLAKMLRHCRGSQHTILAIESTDGHVFGSFTSVPWRLTTTAAEKNSNGTCNRRFYGSKESFVWRMRESRFQPCESVVEQILMESKIDVFPFTSRNNDVQSCTKSGIALGHGEILLAEGDTEDNDDDDDEATRTHHYGHAIQLEKSIAKGSTSSSETFGSPCLIERESRGKEFKVANVELWTMTPHESVDDADQAEMRALFLQEHDRHTDKNNLNLIEILVGTTKS